MSTRRPNKAQRGLTLVELLVVTAVFLVGVTGFLAVMLEARRSTAMARRSTEALALAEDLATQIELWSYGDARLDPTTGEPCRLDPADRAGLLDKLTARDVKGRLTGGAFAPNAFVDCARVTKSLGETYTENERKKRKTTAFALGANEDEQDYFLRMYVVREENADGTVVEAGKANTGVRKRVWVVVAYADGRAAHRVVSYRTLVKREALR
ncbi:MAG TPA: prepilin-type N-terminal cleavage/methylation domain-containing protein [Myxococcaceae bacterium]|nr:prepilin-type N-terminal cleavage/methylation domain-containing protein [Myxococcaceae bacterium]